jgi:A/G-specific adenine glycosylase
MFEKLVKWSHENYHDLPWRRDRNLYTTLVSEIMLQQTTVATVLNHYDRFLKKYPTVKKLAAASEEDVCLAWQGLGYYRRARNLRNAAVDIVEKYQGKFPQEVEELKKIKGIGDYTAGAIVAIGDNRKALAIDANIERVLSRIYGLKGEKGPKLHKKLYELFDSEVAKHAKKVGFRNFNEALMDLGRTFCQARKVSCEVCPMAKKCMALKKGKPLEYPVKLETKVKKYFELDLLRIVVKRGSKLLGYEKAKDKWLNGQVEIPTFVINSEDEKLSQYPQLKKDIEIGDLPVIKTSITKYKIKNYIVQMSEPQFKKHFSIKEYSFHQNDEKTHFSSASKKCIQKTLK